MNFGINFYDSIDYESEEKRYTKEQIRRSVSLTDENFHLLRTITDFNEGDSGQRVGAAYEPLLGSAMNPRNASWQEAIRSTELNVILTIENPKKWLDRIDLAVSYLYQFVLPLCKGFTWPAPPPYQPEYYGTKVDNPQVVFQNRKTHVIAIVVGLEVGAHLNTHMEESQFRAKADIVTNLNRYVTHLLEALDLFSLKDQIAVTSSFAPSNANASADELAKKGIYEWIVQQEKVYSFNINRYFTQGVEIDFGEVLKAIHTMNAQRALEPIGFLLSLYSYWQYQPDVNFPKRSPSEWAKSTSETFQAMITPFEGKPCSIAEIGWPTAGSNEIDGSPNTPSKEVCKNLLKGLLVWSRNPKQTAIQPPNYLCIWQLLDMEEDSSALKENPERYYGFYQGGIKENVDNTMKFPELMGMFKQLEE